MGRRLRAHGQAADCQWAADPWRLPPRGRPPARMRQRWWAQEEGREGAAAPLGGYPPPCGGRNPSLPAAPGGQKRTPPPPTSLPLPGCSVGVHPGRLPPWSVQRSPARRRVSLLPASPLPCLCFALFSPPFTPPMQTLFPRAAHTWGTPTGRGAAHPGGMRTRRRTKRRGGPSAIPPPPPLPPSCIHRHRRVQVAPVGWGCGGESGQAVRAVAPLTRTKRKGPPR